MIPLDDPLWTELPDGRGGTDTSSRLGSLLKRWTRDDAFDLEDDLTCGNTPSPAAIAALPHLLDAAQGRHAKRARKQAPTLLASILTLRSSVHTRRLAAVACPEPMKGATALPVDGWETHLTGDLAARLEADLMDVLPDIRDTIAGALLDAKPQDFMQLLSGLAAAWDEHMLSRALEFGEDGVLRCTACKDCCLWMVFPGTVVLYSNWDEGKASPEMLDMKDNAPTRADAEFEPNTGAVLTAGARALWDAADRDETRPAHDLIRHMLGRVTCPRCGETQAPQLL